MHRIDVNVVLIVMCLIGKCSCKVWERLWKNSPGGKAQPPMRASHGMDILDNDIYIFGGAGNSMQEVYNDVWKFDLIGKNWSRIQLSNKNAADMPVPRYGHGMIVHESMRHKRIYVFGGMSPVEGDGLVGSLEYDDIWYLDLIPPVSWKKVKRLAYGPSNRSEVVMVKRRSSIVIFGGIAFHKPHSAAERKKSLYSQMPSDYNDIWEFNIYSQTWKNISPKNGLKPPPRFSHSGYLSSDGGHLLIFGGRTLAYNSRGWEILHDMWSYSFRDNAWRQLKIPEPFPRCYNSMVVRNKMIFMYGGYYKGKASGNGFVFDDVLKGGIDFFGIWRQSRIDWRKAVYNQSEIIPSVRFNHRSVLWKNLMIIHGGRFQNVIGDMWAFDTYYSKFTRFKNEILGTEEDSMAELYIISSAMILLCISVAVVAFKLKQWWNRTNALDRSTEQQTTGLEQKKMKELKLFKFQKDQHSSKESENLEDVCSICLGEFENDEMLRALVCQHSFHQACIDEWLETKTTCPLCKMDMKDPSSNIANSVSNRTNTSNPASPNSGRSAVLPLS